MTCDLPSSAAFDFAIKRAGLNSSPNAGTTLAWGTNVGANMGTYTVWLILLIGSALTLGQLQSPAPVLPPLAAGLVLLLLGVIAGLRWGADSIAQVIGELSRLNKYLAEQNQELADLDHLLIKQLLEKEQEDELSLENEHSLEEEDV